MNHGESRPAELFVWTDIAPEHETEFNRWYDREHMEERVSIAGFEWARRYRAVSDEERRYLALYRVAGRGVFTSKPYQGAFAQQTDWSNQNFARMRNTQRRVLEVSLDRGAGTGGGLGLLGLGIKPQVSSQVSDLVDELLNMEGVLGLRCLEPDAGLSIPLPSETLEGRILEPYLIIEGTSESEADKAIRAAADALQVDQKQAVCFGLMWELRRVDLKV